MAHSITGYLFASCADDEQELPVVPEVLYVPLYEGRMVHQFDHAAKAYVNGEGRGAKWRDLDLYRERARSTLTMLNGTGSGLVPARAGYLRCHRTNQ